MALKDLISSFGNPKDDMKESRMVADALLEKQIARNSEVVTNSNMNALNRNKLQQVSIGEWDTTDQCATSASLVSATWSSCESDMDDSSSNAPEACDTWNRQTRSLQVWAQAPTQETADIHKFLHHAGANGNSVGTITTLLMKNIPVRCTTSMLMKELKCQGFEGAYDFLYHPVDHQTRDQQCYAFVNFATQHIATAFYLKFHQAFLRCSSAAEGPVIVLAALEQGLTANATRYYTRKSETRHRYRARPIFLQVNDSRIMEVEAIAKKLLLDGHTGLQTEAFIPIY